MTDTAFITEGNRKFTALKAPRQCRLSLLKKEGSRQGTELGNQGHGESNRGTGWGIWVDFRYKV